MNLDEAKSVLFDAVELDKKGLCDQALSKYLEGTEKLIVLLSSYDNGPQKDLLRKHIEQYVSRAESLKSKRSIKVAFMEQRQIADNSTGHSYDRIFEKCLEQTVTEVSIEEPWLGLPHQMTNLVRFCEMLLRFCTKMRRIELATQSKSMRDALEELKSSLHLKGVDLSITYKESMHDREIRFNNGWIVKLGRGLDIYKNVGRFSIGAQDYSFRPCKQTTIEVFKTVS